MTAAPQVVFNVDEKCSGLFAVTDVELVRKRDFMLFGG